MRVTTIAAGAAATGLWAAPAALAGDTTIEPGGALPGETVTVSGSCDRAGDERIRVTSRALRAGPVELDADGRFSVPATVQQVRARAYTVTVTCSPSQVSETVMFTVKSGTARTDTVPYPRGGAGTGGGGTVQADREDGPPVGSMLLLGAMVIAGVGGWMFLWRRARA